MFKATLLFILLGGSDKEYDATARYNDSLLIYNTYRSSIEVLKTLKETERQRWYESDAANDRLTTCAKLRLKKFNHQNYEPVTIFERVGMGVAHVYPRPGSTEHKAPDAFAKSSVPKYHFVVYDKQTHFLSKENCQLRIPYILKLVFDQGRLLFTDKLNPVTFEKLIADNIVE